MTKKEPDIKISEANGSQIKEKASVNVETRVVCSEDKGNSSKYGLSLTRGKWGEPS